MQKGLRRLKGLIIHRSMVREKDMIVEAYTREEGRVSFFAPGIRHVASRRAGHLDTFMETNLVLVHSSKGDSLSEAKAVRTFPRLRENYDRLELIYDIVKSLRHHTGEGQGDKVLYDTVLACLVVAEKYEEMPNFINEIVAVQLLRFLGALPDLYFCTSCRKRLRAGEFSLKSGDRGFWCQGCGEESDPVLTDVVKIIRIFLSAKENAFKLKISDANLRRLHQFTHGLLMAQGGIARV